MLHHILRVITLWAVLSGAAYAYASPRLVELNIDGNTALGDLVIPDGASLADGALLLTHGTLAHKDMELIESLQQALGERGIITLAHTLTLGQDRRTGMYDCARPHTHAHEDAVAEISTWIAWLRKNGAGKVSVLGHSRGGNQAAWFAAEKGGIDKVVLLAPATGRTQQQLEQSYLRRFKSYLAPILEKAGRQNKGDMLLDLPGFIYCQDSKASARSVLSYYGKEPRRLTPVLIPKINRPVFIIAGSKDTVIPDAVEKYTPLAEAENVRLEVVEDAGHMFLDFFTEDAADLIEGFLSE